MMEENKTSNLSNDTGNNEFIVPAKADVLLRKFLLKEKTTAARQAVLT